MSTVERTSQRTAPHPPKSQGRLAGRLAGPGWVIMTLACVWITVIVSRYLAFDPEVCFPEQFSLIMAGVMLRVWSGVYDGLAATGIVDFSFETAYAGIAWLCWVPNLMLAIWFTRRPADVVNAA